MSEFLVEVYVPRAAAANGAPGRDDLLLAARALTRAGHPIHLTSSIVVPSEETCFFLLEAQSGEAIRVLLERTGMQSAHVVEAHSHRTRPTASRQRPSQRNHGRSSSVADITETESE